MFPIGRVRAVSAARARDDGMVLENRKPGLFLYRKFSNVCTHRKNLRRGKLGEIRFPSTMAIPPLSARVMRARATNSAVEQERFIMGRIEKPIKEKNLRAWLRDEWKGGLHFIEHNYGGSVGVSDALLLLPRRMTPCELKRGETRGRSLIFELRSAQRDYHTECYRFGIGTLFLVMVDGKVVGDIGSSVVEYHKHWPIDLWRPISGHSDIERLVNDAWRSASVLRRIK